MDISAVDPDYNNLYNNILQYLLLFTIYNNKKKNRLLIMKSYNHYLFA